MGVYKSGYKDDALFSLNEYFINEGKILDALKSGLGKIVGFFKGLYGKFASLGKQLGKFWGNKRNVKGECEDLVRELARESGLNESYLTEAKSDDLMTALLSSNALKKSVVNKLQVKWNTYIAELNQDYVRVISGEMQMPNFSNLKSTTILRNWILNTIAFRVISEMVDAFNSRISSGDVKDLIQELVSITLNTKMGNTKLPVAQVYGDKRWDIFHRGAAQADIDSINSYISELKNGLHDLKPIVIYIGQSGNDSWNVIHFFTIKTLLQTTEPTSTIPAYFKIILRGSGFTPKINSDLGTFVFDGTGMVSHK